MVLDCLLDRIRVASNRVSPHHRFVVVGSPPPPPLLLLLLLLSVVVSGESSPSPVSLSTQTTGFIVGAIVLSAVVSICGAAVGAAFVFYFSIFH